MNLFYPLFLFFGLIPLTGGAQIPQPSVYIVFTSPSLTIVDLTRISEGAVRERLKASKDVMEVSLTGERRLVLRVWLDAKKMSAMGVTPSEVDAVLASHRYNMTPVGAGGERREMFLMDSKGPDLAAFGETEIKQREGIPIRLADIAALEIGTERPATTAIYQNKPVVALGIIQKARGRALEFASNLTSALLEVKSLLPADVQAFLVPGDGISFQEEAPSQ